MLVSALFLIPPHPVLKPIIAQVEVEHELKDLPDPRPIHVDHVVAECQLVETTEMASACTPRVNQLIIAEFVQKPPLIFFRKIGTYITYMLATSSVLTGSPLPAAMKYNPDISLS